MSSFSLMNPEVETALEPTIGAGMAVVYCNSLHAQIEQSIARAWQTAVVLGYQLKHAKAQLPHGEFGKLFASRGKCDACVAFDFDRRSAQKYMSLYTKCLGLAKKQDTAEQLNDLLQGGAESTLELGDALNKLLPDVQSMRQALLAFEVDNRGAENPFSAPNLAGRIPAAGAGDASQMLENRKSDATMAVDLMAERLQVLLEDGIILMASDSAMARLMSVCQVSLSTLKNALKA